MHYAAKARSWRFPVDKSFTVVGTIRRGEASGSWWFIDSDDLPLPTELSGLDPQLQCDGSCVAHNGHFEAERVGTHIPWMLFFVDDAVAV